jgi:hypothetical protein
VKLAHPIVSHACHLLSVPVAAQVSISIAISVSLVKNAPVTNSNTMVFVSTYAQLVPSLKTDTAKEDVSLILTS